MLAHISASIPRIARAVPCAIFRSPIKPLDRFHNTTSTNQITENKNIVQADLVSLSPEQDAVLEKVRGGESVFFTGPSGTGKSLLLRRVIHQLRRDGRNVAVTASTGIAAVNVEGGTLHSFAGIGIGNQPIAYLLKKAQTTVNKKRWQEADTLIIDEISMVDARTFDIVNQVGKMLRGSTKPFGGLQLVVCGDFFQLPPVPDQMSRSSGIPVSFAFEADCWNDALPTKIALTKVFRQKEEKLVKILNEMRMGEVSNDSIELIRTLSRPLRYDDGIKPTEIFPMRVQADKANERAMKELTGERGVYYASDEFYKDSYGVHVHPQRGRANLDRTVSDRVELRVGAQVMSTKNLPQSDIVNGSVGVVQAFMSPRQVRAELGLESEDSEIAIVSASGRKPANTNGGIWENKRWPVVRFHNGTVRLIPPFCFTYKNALGDVEASRWQIPLILAWALTDRYIKLKVKPLAESKLIYRGPLKGAKLMLRYHVVPRWRDWRCIVFHVDWFKLIRQYKSGIVH